VVKLVAPSGGRRASGDGVHTGRQRAPARKPLLNQDTSGSIRHRHVKMSFVRSTAAVVISMSASSWFVVATRNRTKNSECGGTAGEVHRSPQSESDVLGGRAPRGGGPRIGTVCRILMSREAAVTGSSTVTFLLFNRLKWTPANDDLFEQAI
jgi:hypothetical protein